MAAIKHALLTCPEQYCKVPVDGLAGKGQIVETLNPQSPRVPGPPSSIPSLEEYPAKHTHDPVLWSHCPCRLHVSNSLVPTTACMEDGFSRMVACSVAGV